VSAIAASALQAAGLEATVSRKELAGALRRLAPCIGTRSSLPALGCVALEAAGSRLTIRGTDLELAGSITIGAGVRRAGAVAVPYKVLAELIRGRGPRKAGADVELELEASGANALTVRAAGVATGLRAGALEDMPAPVGMIPRAATFGALELTGALERVSVAASHDEARPILTGLLLELEADAAGHRFALCGTDGYRLALEYVTPAALEQAGFGRRVIPGRVAAALARIAGRLEPTDQIELEAGAEGSSLAFAGAGWRLVTRMIEGEYPNWRQLIPEAGALEHRFAARAGELEAGIRAVLPMAAAGAPVRLELEADRIRLHAGAQDVGEASADVAAATSGAGLVVGLNPGYMLAALGATGAGPLDTVTFGARDGLKPTLWASDASSALYLLMPVRIA
jgi:DNA polymerase-3 subunit beta